MELVGYYENTGYNKMHISWCVEDTLSRNRAAWSDDTVASNKSEVGLLKDVIGLAVTKDKIMKWTGRTT